MYHSFTKFNRNVSTILFSVFAITKFAVNRYAEKSWLWILLLDLVFQDNSEDKSSDERFASNAGLLVCFLNFW